MEKFYCDKCRLIYSQLENCKVCGELATKKIWIEVQKQDPQNK
jgi:RNA polymerase subunit RPABC4/transcription elongation factor Spt4